MTNIFECEYDDTQCIQKALSHFFVDKNLQASIIKNVPIQHATEIYGNLSNYSYDMMLNVQINNGILTSYLPDVSHPNRHLTSDCTMADIVFLHIDYRRLLMNKKMLSYNMSGKPFEDVIKELEKELAENVN